jgi:hypothetical protein
MNLGFRAEYTAEVAEYAEIRKRGIKGFKILSGRGISIEQDKKITR